MEFLYLIRHAQAVPRGDSDYADDDRPLTPNGRKQAQALGAALIARGVQIQELVTSPLPRAVQTAEEILAHWPEPKPELVIREELLPDARSKKLFRFLNSLSSASVALVGHEPDLGKLAGRCIGDRKARIRLGKAGVACVSCAESPCKGCGTLEWLITPEWCATQADEPVARGMNSDKW